MDSDGFDRLMRSFGQARSRRQTLRALAGALVPLLAANPVAAGKGEGKGRGQNDQPGSLDVDVKWILFSTDLFS